jgi:hypothetical protein
VTVEERDADRRLLSYGSSVARTFIELGKTVTLQLGGTGNASPAIDQFVLPTSGTTAASRGMAWNTTSLHRSTVPRTRRGCTS